MPDKPVLTEMAKFFDVGITNEADQTITHTLSTTLIGRDGKVVQFYPGNEWTPDQVVGGCEAVSGCVIARFRASHRCGKWGTARLLHGGIEKA